MTETIMAASNLTICAALAFGTLTAIVAEIRTHAPRVTFARLCGSTVRNSLAAGLGL